MNDSQNRKINYVRISVTDRCNLNCIYCNPNNSKKLTHNDILRFEEYIHVLKILAKHGIQHVRITGGEPLVRKGIVDFIHDVKQIDGVTDVHITTNGTLLYDKIEDLKKAGLDSVNISLDSCNNSVMYEITGRDNCASDVEKCINKLKENNIPVKINAVLIRKIRDSVTELAEYAQNGIPVRFIETMPIGAGKKVEILSPEEVYSLLTEKYPDLHPTDTKLGNGPARYYMSNALKAPIGFITAVSNSFCEQCNRIRITSTGMLKPCLCYNDALDLKEMLRNGHSDEEILQKIKSIINLKRDHHAFNEIKNITETKLMSEIGG